MALKMMVFMLSDQARRCVTVKESKLSLGEKSAKTVRILLVDDNEPFRRFVASALCKKPDLQVVGEAGDGFEALQQAEALQPDLILLDIGLPGLNGLEVARRMGKLAPNARIIFLTQESSADVVCAALSLGGWGYVAKMQAGKELLVAVEMVMQGQRFVSSGLDGHKNRETM
jgi:DNA-binding NarL/FixJ family response regulator